MIKIDYKKITKSASLLSLGISMVVAVLIGVGIGIWLKNIFNSNIFLFIGIAIGFGAAINNVYIAYKQQQKEFEDLQNDPKYNYKKHNDKAKSQKTIKKPQNKTTTKTTKDIK